MIISFLITSSLVSNAPVISRYTETAFVFRPALVLRIWDIRDSCLGHEICIVIEIFPGFRKFLQTVFASCRLLGHGWFLQRLLQFSDRHCIS